MWTIDKLTKEETEKKTLFDENERKAIMHKMIGELTLKDTKLKTEKIHMKIVHIERV